MKTTPSGSCGGPRKSDKPESIAALARRMGIPWHQANARYHELVGMTIDGGPVPPIEVVAEPEPEPVITEEKAGAVLALLRKGSLTLAAVAFKLQVPVEMAANWISELRDKSSLNLHEFGGSWSIERTSPAAHINGEMLKYISRDDNTFVFGATGDCHLGSKYERLDCLNDLYDEFVKSRVDRVFHTGNWIDGEARFNKFDIHTHGMDAQLRYLASYYPVRPGIHTYAVSGDDHEGWYGHSFGVDIGRRAEQTMREEGREDWHHLGHMEAHIKLVNANTGQSSVLAVIHPGGGSSYAYSYQIQKCIESYSGGEKPAVALFGHYHKMEAMNIRNVWTLQTGCFMDQTPFMRKKRLEAHVGGAIVTLRQDPATGAITGFLPDMRRYFNKSYYNDRWSHGGGVVLPERSI